MSNPAENSSNPGPADERDSVLDWARKAGEADRLIGELDRHLRSRRRRRVRAGGYAALALFLAVTSWQVRPWRLPARVGTPIAEEKVAVSLPENRVLADSSVVELKPGADLEVDFTAVSRRVRLRGGAAYFVVAKDASRPFVVVANGFDVRAVGTSFAVDVGTGGLEVLVTEGRVVMNAGSSEGEVVRELPAGQKPGASNNFGATTAVLAELKAGDRAVVPFGDTSPQVNRLDGGEMQQRLGWRVPRLEFANTPLIRALAMCNEHASARQGMVLVLQDADLGDLRVNGILRVDDLDPFLRLLEGEFGLVADRRPGEIRLRRK